MPRYFRRACDDLGDEATAYSPTFSFEGSDRPGTTSVLCDSESDYGDDFCGAWLGLARRVILTVIFSRESRQSHDGRLCLHDFANVMRNVYLFRDYNLNQERDSGLSPLGW